jgi:hypothetical protein
VTTFAYKNSASRLASLADDDLYGSDGVDFLELSDATAGVDFGLSGTDKAQGFEALILSASTDIIDDNALENILYGAGGNDTFLIRAQQEACEWATTQNAPAFHHHG